ncbi:UNKNOWN [Stylonychia lemnae]|uniref:Uncharacterized protein n=1 Tax=Stylonychia lemnae TaxID=5949 RepID=A0A078ASY9_STYLE|nr:UNKNOWN [Stylonychia lemnae]|eukprot:CDW85304.1 UNKNOWN [Stylonychia lemnae]
MEVPQHEIDVNQSNPMRKRSSFPQNTSDISKASLNDNENQGLARMQHFNTGLINVKTKRRGQNDQQAAKNEQQVNPQFPMKLFQNIGNQANELHHIIACPPMFEKDFIQKTTYHAYHQRMPIILQNLMLLRFYLVIRLTTNRSRWTDISSEDSCEKEGFEADLAFAIKSLLKEKPFLMLFMNFTLSILCFGFSVRSFERAYYEDQRFDDEQDYYQNYNYIWNSFWLVVVTMTTGKIDQLIDIQLDLVIFIRSEFTLAEQKAFELLRRLIQKEELKREAAALISAWWRTRKLRKIQQKKFLESIEYKKLGTKKNSWRSIISLATFAQEIFIKRMSQFQKERQRVLRQGIPLSENLQKINKLIENHLKELNNAMMTFREMRKNVEKLIIVIEKDSQSVDNIMLNLQNLDYVLNKIVYLKVHALNMIFKDTIVLKKQDIDDYTKSRGLVALRGLMQNALQLIMKETQQKLFGFQWENSDQKQKKEDKDNKMQQISFNSQSRKVLHDMRAEKQSSESKILHLDSGVLFENKDKSQRLEQNKFLLESYYASPVNPFNLVNNSKSNQQNNITPQLKGISSSIEEEIQNEEKFQIMRDQNIQKQSAITIIDQEDQSYKLGSLRDYKQKGKKTKNKVIEIHEEIFETQQNLFKQDENASRQIVQDEQKIILKQLKIENFRPSQVLPPAEIHQQNLEGKDSICGNDQDEAQQIINDELRLSQNILRDESGNNSSKTENNYSSIYTESKNEETSGSRKKSSVDQGSDQKLNITNSNDTSQINEDNSLTEKPIEQILQKAVRLSVKHSENDLSSLQLPRSSLTQKFYGVQDHPYHAIDQNWKPIQMKEKQQMEKEIQRKLIQDRLKISGQWMQENLPSIFEDAMINMMQRNLEYQKKFTQQYKR